MRVRAVFMGATIGRGPAPVKRVDAPAPTPHGGDMIRDDVNALCAALPGAEWSEPFGPGHDVWKVGDKIFAAMGAQGVGVSLKTPDIDTAQMLIEVGAGLKAPYFHRSWILIPFGGDADEMRHRLHVSYDTVRASLTKKLQASLAPRLP
ncbi:MmcQ/YjbR family DNA-binding protein [Shimia sp. SDUM112013]|uniref:MmcQ/YjbR family DNA-binding protein n=1 Tax=Shimia sp. SDUM112013 TaxID=3136160 RepID=UPI0032EDB5BD